MEARIIGSEAELGDVRGGLTIQGHPLTREWSKIDPTPDQLEKLKGNRYVDLRGGKSAAPKAEPAVVQAEAQEAETAETLRARLDELGVSYPKDAPVKTLQAAVEKAEAAQSKAEQEAEDAAAEAQRLADAAKPAA